MHWSWSYVMKLNTVPLIYFITYSTSVISVDIRGSCDVWQEVFTGKNKNMSWWVFSRSSTRKKNNLQVVLETVQFCKVSHLKLRNKCRELFNFISRACEKLGKMCEEGWNRWYIGVYAWTFSNLFRLSCWKLEIMPWKISNYKYL